MILCGADNSVSGLIYLQHTRFAVLLLVMQKKNIFNIATTHDIMWYRQLSESGLIYLQHTGFAAN